MSLKILCSGYLVRHPVGGLSWHHLQYLLGLKRLGHEVMFVEHFGWPRSCYDPRRQDMTSDPTYGVAYVEQIFARCDLDLRWSYISEDGNVYGAPKDELQDFCTECDVFFNLSNVNWISYFDQCRRRVLVDTDPVFTQIGVHGLHVPFSKYHARFTYGERVHKIGCSMPTADVRWLPTRQPVVLDQWPETLGAASAPFSTVINWSPYPEQFHNGRTYGQKDREFEPYFSLPLEVDEPMVIAANAPANVKRRLSRGGWSLADPVEVTYDPWVYQSYITNSRAEFCVAKHGYVTTQCGWFSDRSTAYLAMGRPVVIQDTGFSAFLPCGEGLLTYGEPQEAISAIRSLCKDYDRHTRTARQIVEQHFDACRVLSELLERSL